MKLLLSQMWGGRRDLALVALVIGVLVVLFVPIPPMLLDFLLVVNISMAMLILLVTFFTDTPLKFSTFPTILLLSTLFRLSLNVSATRLILEGGDAGRVINAIGEFVIGGQLHRRYRGVPDPGGRTVRGGHFRCTACGGSCRALHSGFDARQADEH